MLPSIKKFFEELCYECLLIALILLIYSVAALAQPLGLDEELRHLWDTSLVTVIALSVLGGIVGLLARMQDKAWRDEAKSDGMFLTVVAELSGSIFIGILIFFGSIHYQWTNYMTVVFVLLGSWLGTKATRLLVVWIRENKANLISLLGDKRE